MLLVVLPEGGGGGHHQHRVAEDAEHLVVQRLLERQEVAQLVLRGQTTNSSGAHVLHKPSWPCARGWVGGPQQ